MQCASSTFSAHVFVQPRFPFPETMPTVSLDVLLTVTLLFSQSYRGFRLSLSLLFRLHSAPFVGRYPLPACLLEGCGVNSRPPLPFTPSSSHRPISFSYRHHPSFLTRFNFFIDCFEKALFPPPSRSLMSLIPLVPGQAPPFPPTVKVFSV